MAQNFLPEINIFHKEPPKDMPTKEECVYTKYFCEENVWMMAKQIQEKTSSNLKFCYTVFISNDHSHIPLWRQSASKQEDGLVVWDYHVIMIYCDKENSWVYDFDTQLSFPTEFSKYCEETFKSDDFLKPLYKRFFRVLPAELYLKYFSSDRRHMRHKDGSWKKPLPSYQPIRSIASEEAHNIDHYISMKEEHKLSAIPSGKYGNVFNFNSFIDNFLTKRAEIDYTYPPEPTCL